MVDHFLLSNVRRIPLFATLASDQLEAVAGAFQQARYAPGDWLYRQGDLSSALYYFVSGAGRVVVTGSDGVERPRSDIQPGEFVGEISLFLNERRDTGAVATQDSVVLVLTKTAFDAVLSARPDIRPVLSLRKDILDAIQAQRQHNIRSDEMTLLLTRRHPWAFAGHALIGAVIFAVLIGIALISTQLLPGFAVLPLGLLALAFIIPAMMGVYFFFEWRNDYYVITNQRIIHEERSLLTGQEQREQALLVSVQNVNVSRRGPIAEVIGFGDVVVDTAGAQRPLVLNMIPTPAKVQQVIFQQMQRRREQEANGTLQPMMDLSPSPVYAQHQPGIFERFLQAIIPRMRVVEGDRITYRKHWIVLLGNIWKPTAAYILLGLLLGIRLSGRVTIVQSIPGIVVLGIAFVWLALNTFWWYWEYADWYDDLYIIDNQSVIDIKRRPLWLNEIRLQAGLQQIQNVTSRIGGVWGQLVNVGDVAIQTAAEHGIMTFKSVYNPSAVSEEILRRMQMRVDLQANANQQQQRQLIAQYMAQYVNQPQQQPPQQPPAPRYPTPPTPVPPEQRVPPPIVISDDDTPTSRQGATPTLPMKPTLSPDDTQGRPADLGHTQASEPPRPPETPL